MKKLIILALIAMAFCSFKTPETSKLFTKASDPETGVEFYVLKQGIAGYNQQGLYFVNKSMSNDGRFLVFTVSGDEMSEEKPGKEYWLIDFKSDTLFPMGLKKASGGAYLDVRTNILYYGSVKEGKVFCRKLNEDPLKDIVLCDIPKELTSQGKLVSLCSHNTVSRDGKYMFCECRIDDRFIQGLIEFSTGKFIKWYETDHIINHGEIHPYRNDIAIAAYEVRWTDKNGVLHKITDVPGPYPRLQLFEPGKNRMVPPMDGYASHERWADNGKGFYWCGRDGVFYCNLESGEQQKVSPMGAHAMMSDDERFVVSDNRIGKMYRGEPWRLFFWDRETEKGIYICSTLPPATPFEHASKLHPDPHPQFVCNDKYIIFTKNEWKHRFTLGVCPVKPLVERLNTKWIGDIPEANDPLKIYRKLTRQLVSCPPEAYAPKGYDGKRPVGNGKQIHYATNSAYVNAMNITMRVGDKSLRDSVFNMFKPFVLGNKTKLQSIDYHVDHSIFGALACEFFYNRGNDKMREVGLRYADHQWEEPDPVDNYGNGNKPYEQKMEYLRQGYTPQTRLWIDDMYMINVLQTAAYRITGDPKYIERAAKEMVLYLKELQQPDGLFHHAVGTPFVWGRGDGWMAAGMPMILQYLTPESEYYAPIREGYLKMMKSLLKWQRTNGLWGQLVTDPESWDETSCSAMFTYAFIQGVKHGWLDAKTYGQAARNAWITLSNMLDEYGNLPGVCIGTGEKNDRQWYLDRPRVNGDPHGQAPMLWICNALL